MQQVILTSNIGRMSHATLLSPDPLIEYPLYEPLQHLLELFTAEANSWDPLFPLIRFNIFPGKYLSSSIYES